MLKLAEHTERTHSTLRGHVAVVVPMFRALIVITSVDRLGSVALTLSQPGGGGHIVPPPPPRYTSSNISGTP